MFLKLIEKLYILNQLHQSEIKDLRQRLSKNALIIGKQCKELKTLSDEKRGFEIELDNMYQSIISEIIEQSKELKILREDKEKMELDLNYKLEGKECEIHLHLAQLNLETFKLNNVIGRDPCIRRLTKDIEILRKSKDKMELELNNALQSKETKIRKCQKQVEETLEMKAWTSGVQKQIIEKLKQGLKSLREEKEKIESELVGKESEVQLIQAQFTKEIFRLNDIIGKLRKLCWRN